MNKLQSFELEHYQSLHERTVDYNLADSSVKCTGVSDWLDEGEIRELLDTGLYYPEINGTRALRERIAALYAKADPTITPDNVLVTVGAAEAGGISCQALLVPGDEVIVVAPGYRQVWGIAKNSGCVVRELHTRAEDGWRPDLDALAALVTAKTTMVSIVNPNNPTGTVLTEAEMDGIVAICARHGLWLHADEVYAETEVSGPPALTFRSRYDKLVCTNSMSKAYGLSGLRIGWVVASGEVIQACWRCHEYATIAAASPSMTLAEIALRPAKRAWLLARQRRLSREGRAVLERWLPTQEGRYAWTASAATPVAFVRQQTGLGSFELCEYLRREASVLIAPGSLLGADGFLRVTVGYPAEKIEAALERVGSATAALLAARAARVA